MRDGRDARCAVDRQAYEAAADRRDLAGVQSDPDADRCSGRPRFRGQRQLGLECCSKRPTGGRKYDEEGIALRALLEPAMNAERCAEELAVSLPETCIGRRPDGLLEACGPLDIR